MTTYAYKLSDIGAQALKGKRVDCYYHGMPGVGSLKESAYAAAEIHWEQFRNGTVIIDEAAWAGHEAEGVAVALGMRKRFARHIVRVTPV